MKIWQLKLIMKDAHDSDDVVFDHEDGDGWFTDSCPDASGVSDVEWDSGRCGRALVLSPCTDACYEEGGHKYITKMN